ncbi:MAG: xanthine dehydrogenase accessory protein XdhC [Sneathiellales bacterium]|nr:xanthine dehydrogenase accessory protein XdhC [Sneathiellales bacterium]
MSFWQDILQEHIRCGYSSVLVTLAIAKGSTPRNVGSHLLVTERGAIGTIGGGNLEYNAVNRAKELLKERRANPEILDLPLGPELAQCCGGHVTVLLSPLVKKDLKWLQVLTDPELASDCNALLTTWKDNILSRTIIQNMQGMELQDHSLSDLFKRYQQSRKPEFEEVEKGGLHFSLIEPASLYDFHVTLFGAGHIGQALVNILKTLPCQIDWIDQRKELFPLDLPEQVMIKNELHPSLYCDDIPKDSFVLVMTHDHQLDFKICEKVLKNSSFSFLGLIGSETKSTRFRKRLRRNGIEEKSINNLVCPIGLSDLGGKLPAEIAISVAADLLARKQILETNMHGELKGNTFSVQQE